jgi:hypothetical protein
LHFCTAPEVVGKNAVGWPINLIRDVCRNVPPSIKWLPLTLDHFHSNEFFAVKLKLPEHE